MIEQTPVAPPAQETFVPLQKVTFWSKIRPFWLKFYSNKRVFWPVSIAFGLIILTIITGLIFGNGGVVQNVIPGAVPTPVAEASPTPSPPGDLLTQIERSLTDLKTQIDSLDVKQSRLQPPTFDFKISF